MRRILTATIGALALLGLPAVAQAHHITSGTATCTQVSATYASFSESNKPIAYQVYVDSALILSGTDTFPGSSGTITKTYPQPLAAGNHVVKWVSTWPNQGSEQGSFEKTVTGCSGPPVTVAPPAPPAPVVPESAPVAPPAPQTAPVVPPVKKVTPKPRKRCEFGRRHLRYKHGPKKGQRFTLCIVRHKAPVTPHFTG